MPLTIQADNFDQHVMQEEKPVLIDFWAAWCGPCRMAAPIINKLAEDYRDRAVIAKVNVDEEMELAQQFRIMSIPSLYILKKGQVVERIVGVRPYEELAAKLDEHL